MHLDGARVFNAAVALNTSVAALAQDLDSVMFCLSKGLGAPVGSMIAGSGEFIEKARIYRKMFGGGMRQAGVLAAAGRIALEESPKRLLIDHQNARRLAEGIAEIPGLHIDPAKVQTNIVIFDCQQTGLDAVQLCEALKPHGIWALDTAPHRYASSPTLTSMPKASERALRVLREVVAKTHGKTA